jgi:hypothetical protein
MNYNNNLFYVILCQNYCTKPNCTTCGCLPFRKAAQALGAQLFESMMALDETAVLSHADGLNAVYLAFCCIPDIVKRNVLIDHWPNIFRFLSLDNQYEFLGSLLTPVFTEFISQ